MRSPFLLAALPALILGLAACDDQTAQNKSQPGGTSTAERPATTPPPPAGTPGQNASGVGGTGTGGPMAPGAAPTATTPGATRPGGTSGNTQ
ncbi:hypothetical protein [Azospirillum sp.]|uniref:hypothetical protein n=1 Tax=Azospirillum sp. TaxID=34012 RepID=UPI003D70AFC3